MACSETASLSNEEYLKLFNSKVARRRIPLSGSMDLTYRCNLRCVHCYLSGQTEPGNGRGKELKTAQWLSILDQITEAGCLYLVLTGGEPLLRKDFRQLYTHAKKNGLLVTVFTNGSLVTDSTAELFQDLPPYAVEISVYGATASTYEKITRVEGSFRRCMTGIEKLLAHRVRVKLKTILMTCNRHEFQGIKDLANTYDVPFRFDAAIFPCLNGDKAPTRLRVSPEEAIEKEFSDERVRSEWQDFLARCGDVPPSDDLYQCGAGLAMFHIDPNGSLRPCVMVTSAKYDLLSGSFSAGWHEVLPEIRKKRLDPGNVCSHCEKKLLCGYCPGFFKLENGRETEHCEYLCTMGQFRFEAIQHTL